MPNFSTDHPTKTPRAIRRVLPLLPVVSRGRRTAPQATKEALSARASLATDLPFICGPLERSADVGTFRHALPDTVALSLAHFPSHFQERSHSSSPISPRAARHRCTPLGPFPVTHPSRATPPFQPTLAFIGRAVGVAGLDLSFNYEPPAKAAGSARSKGSRFAGGISSNGRRNSCDRSFAR